MFTIEAVVCTIAWCVVVVWAGMKLRTADVHSSCFMLWVPYVLIIGGAAGSAAEWWAPRSMAHAETLFAVGMALLLVRREKDNIVRFFKCNHGAEHEDHA